MIFLGFQVQERDNRQVQEQKQVIPAPVEPRYADDEPSAASSTSSPEVPLEKQPFFRFEVVTVEEQDGMQSRLDIYNEGEPAFDLVVRKANYLRLHTDEGPLVLPVWFYLDATFSQESLGYLASLHSRPMPFSGRYGGDQNFLKSLLATLGRDLGESTIAAAVGAADSGRDLVVEQIR